MKRPRHLSRTSTRSPVVTTRLNDSEFSLYNSSPNTVDLSKTNSSKNVVYDSLRVRSSIVGHEDCDGDIDNCCDCRVSTSIDRTQYSGSLL